MSFSISSWRQRSRKRKVWNLHATFSSEEATERSWLNTYRRFRYLPTMCLLNFQKYSSFCARLRQVAGNTTLCDRRSSITGDAVTLLILSKPLFLVLDLLVVLGLAVSYDAHDQVLRGRAKGTDPLFPHSRFSSRSCCFQVALESRVDACIFQDLDGPAGDPL